MSSNGTVDEVEVNRLFIGAGCNRIVNNVSCGACDLVSAVAIFFPKIAQILSALWGHKASINCTHWLPSNKFVFKGSINNNSRNMAVGSGFMEGNGSLAVLQFNNDTNQVLS